MFLIIKEVIPLSQLLSLFKRWSNPQKIAFSFLAVIFIGSLLLSLPISHIEGNHIPYTDNLFTAVSAVCVTGLVTQTVADTYSLFGQVILILLIQIGGLGLMTIIGVIYFQIGQKLSLSDQATIADSLNRDSLSDTKSFIANIFKYTAIIEGIGTLLFSFYFVPSFGLGKGVFTSIFLSISAFCNAGFDPLGGTSLIGYQQNPLINFTVMALIILGGIGFSVWFDITQQVKQFDYTTPRWSFRMAYKNLHSHTKLALLMTSSIILIGTLFFCLAEWQNPQTIGQLSVGDKLMTAMFQTITMRTAGFATIDYTAAHPVTLFLFIVTMFIGGSPGGTAGGLKTTTFALILFMILAEIRQKENINFAYRTIPRHTVRKAFVIFMLYMTLLIIGMILLLLFDPQANFLYLLFESVSAIATVGVTANLTPDLSLQSHLVIMFMMFIGRIGPMTLFLSLRLNKNDNQEITYARGNILIG